MFPRGLLAVGLLCAFAACTPAHILRFDTRKMVGLHDFTGVHELEVDCPGAVDELEVEFSHDCKAGKMQLQVTSPSGETVFTRTAGPGTGDEEFHSRGSAGKWRCRIELSGFTGDYHAVLEARGNWPGATTRTRSVEVYDSTPR